MASPRENALAARYADILDGLANIRKLQASGQDNAAQQLIDTLTKQFAGWSKDWTAFQRANGIKEPTPAQGATP